ncbi:MAG: S8/S53 family peptidase [Blastocatellia bacterium]|nr:S8/S53 family peptidase [Blastocatellia bacterium]
MLILILLIISFSIFSTDTINASTTYIPQIEEETSNIPASDLAISFGAVDLGTMQETEKVSATIYFKLQNPDQLDKLLSEQQNPTSPHYQKWLTPSQFAEQFGAKEDEVDQTASWLKSSGAVIKRVWTSRLAMEFEATPLQIEQLFATPMHNFSLKGHRYYGNERNPKIPAKLKTSIETVKLNNFHITNPTAVAYDLKDITTNFAGGGRIALGPEDFYLAYNVKPLFDEGIDGAGQKIGIVARCDFDMKDVEVYRSTFKLPPSNVVKIAADDEIVNLGGIEETEVLLNTQLSGMVAPKARIEVVIAGRNAEIDQSLAFLVNNMPDTKLINISFGLCEQNLQPTFQSVFNNLYKQAAAQGQTVFVATGNGGANDCRDGSRRQVNGLASSPHVVAVGGTTLELRFDNDGRATEYVEETAWTGGGGGLSDIYSRPAYQSVFSQNELEGSSRAMPDVSMLGDPSTPGYFIVQNGSLRVTGGTSSATPCWLAVYALTNQFAKTTLGPPNARIYQLGIAQQRGGTSIFNDVTKGTNTIFGVTGFAAKPGFDLCSGWGSPNANLFVRNFTAASDSNSRGLFLLQPNGGEVLSASEAVKVKWSLNQQLADQVVSQDILISTDAGQTFRTIATNLDKNRRDFDFMPSSVKGGNIKFQIVARTNNATVTDTSDTFVNIGTDLRIELGLYSRSLRQLELQGRGFDRSARIFINSERIRKKPKMKMDGVLTLNGDTQKLKLKDGPNQIVIEIDGVRSAPYSVFL